MNAHHPLPQLKVILPEELDRFYNESGYLAPAPHEERRHARLNVRTRCRIRFFSENHRLLLDGIAADENEGMALVKDLSRTGIAILYHRQIFPGERFEVLVHRRTIEATAVRCRRIGPLCFETGAIINSVLSEPSSGPSSGPSSEPE